MAIEYDISILHIKGELNIVCLKTSFESVRVLDQPSFESVRVLDQPQFSSRCVSLVVPVLPMDYNVNYIIAPPPRCI